ncbi:MAG: hypothetical protein JWM32_3084 [Verrucomicrobia bacterium]|nr:hypothetical protein [Verrucomicrobiota bacterium]
MNLPDIFITKYQNRPLPYAAEVVAALRKGAAHVTHTPKEFPSTSASELLRTYEIRRKHLARFDTAHAAELRRDVDAFCEALTARKSDRCGAWGIESSPYFIYWFWEWASDDSLVGVTKAVDDRRLSDAERSVLWGEKRPG